MILKCTLLLFLLNIYFCHSENVSEPLLPSISEVDPAYEVITANDEIIKIESDVLGYGSQQVTKCSPDQLHGTDDCHYGIPNDGSEQEDDDGYYDSAGEEYSYDGEGQEAEEEDDDDFDFDFDDDEINVEKPCEDEFHSTGDEIQEICDPKIEGVSNQTTDVIETHTDNPNGGIEKTESNDSLPEEKFIFENKPLIDSEVSKPLSDSQKEKIIKIKVMEFLGHFMVNLFKLAVSIPERIIEEEKANVTLLPGM